MRALIQRTTGASVAVDGKTVGEIGHGLVVLLCALRDDGDEDVAWITRKTVGLRIFRDEADRMNRSVVDVRGSILVISQFTLAAETKGNRPGFSTAAAPQEGRRLYEQVLDGLTATGVPIATGRYGADMAVSLTNDGPVTIWLDSKNR